MKSKTYNVYFDVVAQLSTVVSATSIQEAEEKAKESLKKNLPFKKEFEYVDGQHSIIRGVIDQDSVCSEDFE